MYGSLLLTDGCEMQHFHFICPTVLTELGIVSGVWNNLSKKVRQSCPTINLQITCIN